MQIDLTEFSNWFHRIEKEVKYFTLSIDFKGNFLNIKVRFVTFSDSSLGSITSIPISGGKINLKNIHITMENIEKSLLRYLRKPDDLFSKSSNRDISESEPTLDNKDTALLMVE